jgi:hypothetical protein
MLSLKLRQVSTAFKITQAAIETPTWFPRSISDLDVAQSETICCQEAYDGDHPTFDDAESRARRQMIGQMAADYQFSDGQIPRLDYTEAENQ